VTGVSITCSIVCDHLKAFLSEIMQPLCITKDGLYHHWDLGLQPETAGLIRRRGVMAQEKEPGGDRVGCGVGEEWDWGLETGSPLFLGGD